MGSHGTRPPALPKLTFSKLQVGPMGTPWNLEIFLFRGAAAINRRKADAALRERTLEFLNDRLPVMVRAFESLRKEMWQHRTKAREGALQQNHVLGAARRQIARIHTVLSEQRRAQAAAGGREGAT